MKADHTISCPACHHPFPIEAVFAGQLREKIEVELRSGYDARFVKERATLLTELTRTAQAEAARTSAAKLADFEASAAERETALKRLQTQLETTRREASQRARDEFTAERKGLEEELGRQRAALTDLRRNELELRREKTRLEAARQELEVQNARTLDADRVRLRDELTRTLDTERIRVREELASAHAQAQSLRDAEHDQQTATLRRQVEELRRKLESGGEQRRGEVCEVRLEEFLRATFPSDTIEAVSPGVNGADVCQHVCAPGASPCGTIIFENKHTANWQPRWIAKLKEDMRSERADVAVIVTAALPKNVSPPAWVEGVWVTSFACLSGLTQALRLTMLQVATHRQAIIGRGEKMELAYAYMTGEQFRQRVEKLFEVISNMDHDLGKEKRAATLSWARRETQLNQLADCLTGVYGDMQGIVGAKVMPTIEAFEVTSLLENHLDNTAKARQVALL